MRGSRRFLTPQNVALAVVAAVTCMFPSGTSRADFMGTLFYTTFSGGTNVNRVDYDYNPGVSFTLLNNKGITSTPGADGVVFTSDGYLAVGGQSGSVYKVNPTTGAFTSVNTGNANITAYEMMASPNGTVFSSGSEGGTPTPVSYNPTLSVNGTAHPVTGSDTGVTHIAWTDPNTAFYTISGSGGFGNFGKIDPTTFVTTRTITNLPAAHGMTYDPYTGDLILFGDGHITQIDPNNPSVVLSDLTLSLGSSFDQGAVDGQGHIFVANNGGDLAFIDISNSKLVGSADFIATPFLAGSLDDIAPLVGAGSSSTPEPASIALVTAGGLALLGYGYRRRQKRAAC